MQKAFELSGSADHSLEPAGTGRLTSIALAMGLIMIGLGQTVLYTVLGPAARQIGISELQTGAIVSLTALVLTIASPLWGRLIDRYGSRTVYLVGMVSYTVGSVVFAATLGAGLWYSLSPLLVLTVLLSVRSLYALMTAGIHPAAMAYIAKNTPEASRASGMALMAACNGIGSALGPLLGSGLATFGLLVPLFAASALALVATLLGAVSIKKDVPAARAVDARMSSIRMTDQRVLLPLVGTVLVYAAFSSLQQSLAFFVQDKFELTATEAIHQTGIVVAVLAATMMVTQLGLIQFFKPGPVVAVSCGSFLAVVGFVLIATWSVTLTRLAISQILVGGGVALLFPGLQAALSNAVTIDKQGSVAGLSFGAASFGYVAGPLLGTGLLSVSLRLPYLVGAAAVACAGVVVLRSLGVRQHERVARA
ncbi:MFS transporter [Nocardia brasiliensis]|uniref:MFS transporter n=1 Tax=Nocardia brasiliensis TaxID=37326 RepID=UPI00366AF8C5